MSRVDSFFAEILAPIEVWAYALLRIISGSLFAVHGAQKVFGILGRTRPDLLSQMGVGGVIELVGGVLIALGIGTRGAAFLSSGTMAVAYVQFHWKFELGERFLPAVNRGELAVIYAVVFLFIACRGAGSKLALGK